MLQISNFFLPLWNLDLVKIARNSLPCINKVTYAKRGEKNVCLHLKKGSTGIILTRAVILDHFCPIFQYFINRK